MRATTDPRAKASILWDLPVALVLLTRLPLPAMPAHVFASGARATWSYPIVGLLLAVLVAPIWYGAQALALHPMICALLTLGGLTLITGGLHEDGLADTADGLWGGMTKERRLEIMRDSRIGSYGMLALVLIVPLRVFSLSLTGPIALALAASLSRAVLPAMMYLLPHARADGLSHSVGRPPLFSCLIALGAALLCVVYAPMAVFALLVPLAMSALALRKIGGQTGDILGATQQLTEAAVLVMLSSQLIA